MFEPLQDSEAIAKDEVQKVLMMTEERRRAWENAWESQRNKLEQNLQISQFYFDLRAVSTCPAIIDFIRVSNSGQKLAIVCLLKITGIK